METKCSLPSREETLLPIYLRPIGNGHTHMTKLPECHTESICGSQEEASAPLCYPVHLALIISFLALILGHAFQLADTLT